MRGMSADVVKFPTPQEKRKPKTLPVKERPSGPSLDVEAFIQLAAKNIAQEIHATLVEQGLIGK
jgi:hypothetical protein